VVLSAIGGAIGVAIGAAILRVAPVIIPEGLLPGTVALAFDGRIVAFCALSSLIVGGLFGVAPAWQATSFSSPDVMASDTRTTTGGGGKLRNLLVMGEVATAVLLLFGAGLLLRTLIAVESYDRGYRADGVLTLMLDPLGSTYPTPEKLQQFYDQVEAEVRTVPGVQDVAYSSALPMGTSMYGDFALTYQIVGDPPVPESQRPVTNYQVVSPSYFSAVDLPIVAGRAFDQRDRRDSPKVCIVNEAFAKTLGGRNPIGMQVAFKVVDSPSDEPNVGEIVGVAKQVKGRPDESSDFVQIYVPMAHDLLDDTFLMVRAKNGRAEALTSGVRAAISRVDRDRLVNVQDITTLDDIAWSATGRHRFRAVMVTAFAALAVTLAMVGVFGILAYSVQQRVRDFGVRRALGATTNDVLALVLRDALRVIAIGAGIGLLLAAESGRLMSSLLFGVQPLDLTTFALVTIVLGVTTAMSIVGPALRATRIDPAVALRSK
jgi:putative ABC transport system permease protein